MTKTHESGRFEISVPQKSIENEITPETEDNFYVFLQTELSTKYTDHLQDIETTSLGILDSVISSARIGFKITLILNVLSFVLGTIIIITGLIILVMSPEQFERMMGIVLSFSGVILVIVILFWKGPLDRILESVSNLARINIITLGLSHRLNQISQVFVQKSLQGEMSTDTLKQLNEMVQDAVHNSVFEFNAVLPKKNAETQVKELLSKIQNKNLFQ